MSPDAIAHLRLYIGIVPYRKVSLENLLHSYKTHYDTTLKSPLMKPDRGSECSFGHKE